MERIPDWLNRKFIAHRGYFNKLVPENSLSAFELAINKGFAIELDVQMLKCGTLVVFHDTNLNRMTGLNKMISDAVYNDIKNLKLNDSDDHIPTLAETLNFIDGKTPLMIEFKNESLNNKLEECSYEILKNYSGEYVIQSFNPLSVKWFKNNAEHIIRGQLSNRYKSKRHSNLSIIKKIILRNVMFNIVTKPDFVIYDIKGLNSLIIKYLIIRKRPVFAYTAKSIEEYKYALNFGIRSCFEGFDPTNEKNIDFNIR